MQLFEEHQHEYQQLLRPGPLKIGIQIRTGDRKMGDSTLVLKEYRHFFDCAAQLEVGRSASAATASNMRQSHAQKSVGSIDGTSLGEPGDLCGHV